jgi:hypothetical protein
MIRPVFALMTRALTEESRLTRTHLARGALLAVVLMMLIGSARSFGRVGAAGKELFMLVMMTNLAFLSLGAITHISSAVAEEKEDETLGLLRMTRLNPLSILLGKGASREFTLGVLVLLQVPFTLLTITLGGVSFTQIAAAYVVALAYVVLLTGLGLLCSVAMSRTSTATVSMSVILGTYLLGPFVGQLLCWTLFHGASRQALSRLSEEAFYLNPFGRLTKIMETGFGGPVVDRLIGGGVVLGLLFFLIAWAGFDRFTREQKGVAPSRGLLLRTRRRSRWLGAGPVWGDGLAWKDFNFLAGGRPMVIVRVFVYSLLTFGLVTWWAVDRGIWANTTSAEAPWMAVLLVAALAVESSVLLLRAVRGTLSGSRIVWRLPVYSIVLLTGTVWWVNTIISAHRGLNDLAGVLLVGASFVLALELAVAASRIFGTEVKWGTWPSLAVLPRSLGGVVRRKTAGALLGLAPALLFWSGVISFMFFFCTDTSSDELVLILPGLLVEALFCAHIVVAVSLYVKHGAILVGAMGYILVMGILPAIMEWSIVFLFGWLRDPGDGEYVAGLALRAVMIVALQVFIMKRLRRLAAA